MKAYEINGGFRFMSCGTSHGSGRPKIKTLARQPAGQEWDVDDWDFAFIGVMAIRFRTNFLDSTQSLA